MPEKQKSKRRSFSTEFKQDAVDLIVKQGSRTILSTLGTQSVSQGVSMQ